MADLGCDLLFDVMNLSDSLNGRTWLHCRIVYSDRHRWKTYSKKLLMLYEKCQSLKFGVGV